MIWTTDKPTETGWYWCRDLAYSDAETIVDVLITGSIDFVQGTDIGRKLLRAFITPTMEWQPVQPPKD